MVVQCQRQEKRRKQELKQTLGIIAFELSQYVNHDIERGQGELSEPTWRQ